MASLKLLMTAMVCGLIFMLYAKDAVEAKCCPREKIFGIIPSFSCETHGGCDVACCNCDGPCWHEVEKQPWLFFRDCCPRTYWDPLDTGISPIPTNECEVEDGGCNAICCSCSGHCRGTVKKEETTPVPTIPLPTNPPTPVPMPPNPSVFNNGGMSVVTIPARIKLPVWNHDPLPRSTVSFPKFGSEPSQNTEYVDFVNALEVSPQTSPWLEAQLDQYTSDEIDYLLRDLDSLEPKTLARLEKIDYILTRTEPWERAHINEPGLSNNCPMCTFGGILGLTSTQVATALGISEGTIQLHLLPEFFNIMNTQLNSQTIFKTFESPQHLFRQLDQMILPGQRQRFALGFYPDPSNMASGHLVVLKAWKTTLLHTVKFRVIDFQLPPNHPGRYMDNRLPNGPLHLFCVQQNPVPTSQSVEILPLNRYIGSRPQVNQWFKLEDTKALAKSGVSLKVPTYTSRPFSTGFAVFGDVDNLRPTNDFRDEPINNGDLKNDEPEQFRQPCNQRIIGYYAAWTSKRLNAYQAARLTHVVFSFMPMQADGTVSDTFPDDAKSKSTLLHLLDLAQSFPHLKVMFAVGGWSNSLYFYSMASSQSSRARFIYSVMQLINKYKFDGVDLDWEHPVFGGEQNGTVADKQNYVLLMRELRAALGDKYLLTFAGAAGEWTLEPGYDLEELLKYANWVNVMTYDYYGAWGSKWGVYTGPPSPLFSGIPAGTKILSKKLNADYTLKYYTCIIKQPKKIVMGIPFYGRFWQNVGEPIAAGDGMWRLASPNGQSHGGPDGGEASFREIKHVYLKNPAFEQHFHEQAKAPYLWNPSTRVFLGYENAESIGHKMRYALEKDFGGVMFWAIDQDDEENTLLNAVTATPLCSGDSNEVKYKCPLRMEKRWWTYDENPDLAGMCGRSAPLYNGFYPICNPNDEDYGCCGSNGYCGSGDEYCKCPTCVNYVENPERVDETPVRPSGEVGWHFTGHGAGRCGYDAPLINGRIAVCNGDDPRAHCCSTAGYCGTGPAFCDCDGCVNFSKTPDFKYPPITWLASGRCGPTAERVNGDIARCDPKSKYHCCSAAGYCGSTNEHCNCETCIDYARI